MKTKRILSVLLLFVATCVCLSSCNKDDDNKKVEEFSIVGTWVYTETDNDDYKTTETWVFNSGGSGSYSYEEIDPENEVVDSESRSFEFTIQDEPDDNGNTWIQIIYNNKDYGNRKISYVLTASKLIIDGTQYTRQ